VPEWSTRASKTPGAASTASAPPGWVEISPSAADPSERLPGQRLGDEAAHRPADDDGPLDPQRVEQRDHVRGHPGHPADRFSVGEGRAPEPDVVRGEHPEVRREPAEEGRIPVGPGRRVAVQQQERLAVADGAPGDRPPGPDLDEPLPRAPAGDLGQGSTSTVTVTGPSLISATPMQAPKTPFFAPVRSQKRS
jgi:hypothetical protein